MTTLFISDLHLHAAEPAAVQAFYAFLAGRARSAQALYILGDFFDAWIGDDDDAPLGHEVAAKLRELADTGVDIYLMPGNRDFVLGHDFANRAGGTMLPDPTVIELYGKTTVLLHGDSLCTRDEPYMALRAQLRSPEWQAQALAQPLQVRRAMAEQLRAKSKTMNSSKPEDIMDVTPEAVVEVLREHSASLMIHGHTHRPERHPLTVDGVAAERIVLGDWHDNAWCLVADETSLTLEHWPINA
ncbi:UDP-2,3-diacylglucosamine diphosphatase [Gilvimarinus agarilyticus]|uniref:UDP-2,3-diacylglucosamine diphosphatase n=1 Tax=Gilvimarinus agarilyticus TaxID=679259 RepID=UPI0005A29A52|nr:UDP-2,3-diacylglucosamine diphosphatase [Gilvimarinus agarilyticus]